VKKSPRQIWREKHENYIASEEWAQLRRTMPGPRQCVFCGSTCDLNLHHMVYPKDIYQTRHHHCCWLCRRCHEAFHARVRGTWRDENRSEQKLINMTKRIIARQLRSLEEKTQKSEPHSGLVVVKARAPVPTRKKPQSTAPEYLKELRRKFNFHKRRKSRISH
jgi:hypothetical protein